MTAFVSSSRALFMYTFRILLHAFIFTLCRQIQETLTVALVLNNLSIIHAYTCLCNTLLVIAKRCVEMKQCREAIISNKSPENHYPIQQITNSENELVIITLTFICVFSCYVNIYAAEPGTIHSHLSSYLVLCVFIKKLRVAFSEEIKFSPSVLRSGNVHLRNYFRQRIAGDQG